MEEPQTGVIALTEQQQSRIASLLLVPAEDLSSLFTQLQDGSQVNAALPQLIQYLNQRATQEPAVPWKEQAEEAKAALGTEKINMGKMMTCKGHETPGVLANTVI